MKCIVLYITKRFIVFFRTKTRENVNISWHGIGTLCRVQGKMNAQKYIGILNTQDISLRTTMFFKMTTYQCIWLVLQRNINTIITGSLVWPVQSPEINIIEPVGIELKERSKIIPDKSNPDQLVRCEVFLIHRRIFEICTNPSQEAL